MPTYEYVCTDCATPLEVVASFSDATLTECPACGGRLRKVFGNVGVVFKGSGFYRTDSRSKTPPTKVESTPAQDKPASSGSDKAPASTTPSKSSTGAPTKATAAPAAASAS